MATTPGPLADLDFGVLDLHAHPMLKTYTFGHKFWKAHNPPGFMFPLCMRTDLDALLAGGCQGFLSACYVVERGIEDDAKPLRFLKKFLPKLDRALTEEPDDMCREQMNHFRQVIEETRRRRGDVIEIANGFGHMQEIMAEGRIAVVQSIEGAHVLKGSLETLEEFYERGVAHMIVPHFYPNEATFTVDAIPHNMPLRKLGLLTREYHLDRGLTDWGHQLINRMFDLGMIVDVTHGTPPMRQQVYELARAHQKKRPVIMSHVGVHEFAPYPMNPTADDIRQIAETGGTVGIIMMTYWLEEPEPKYGEEIILKTINHLMKHGGEDVVAIGSDFDGFTGPPKDFKSPRDFVRLRELLRRHYTDDQVRKFLRGNAERVLREGWGKA